MATSSTRAARDVDGIDGVDDRDVRAATRKLTVLPDEGPARDAPGLFTVVSDSGSEYLVDAVGGTCECPDHEYRDVRCLHLRRVAFAQDPARIPDAIPEADVDEQLGLHVDRDGDGAEGGA